jgi:hypothetical protein
MATPQKLVSKTPVGKRKKSKKSTKTKNRTGNPPCRAAASSPQSGSLRVQVVQSPESGSVIVQVVVVAVRGNRRR